MIYVINIESESSGSIDVYSPSEFEQKYNNGDFDGVEFITEEDFVEGTVQFSGSEGKKVYFRYRGTVCDPSELM